MSRFHSDALKALINDYVPDLVATRRDLHQHPELAFEEVRTSGLVAQRLRALGLEVQTGIATTGVVGLLRGGSAGPGAKTIAIRADMDALPIAEENEVAYRSQVEGTMHACGHDGHTAILLAVAEILSKHRAELAGNVKFLFQPAEETGSGAKRMVEQGGLRQVDALIGLHLISDIPSGRVGVWAGEITTSADDFVLTVTGRGGHAASPHEAIDPIVIAAQIITAFQTLISRETSPFRPSVITIGEIRAGAASNVIPQTAVMRGTLRTFSNTHRAYLLRRIGEVAQGIASTLGGSCEIEQDLGCPSCSNDPAITALVRQVAESVVGTQMLEENKELLGAGSDDMAEFLQVVPGCYFMVGSGNEAKGTHYQHHHPRFDLDEDALPLGVELLLRTAIAYLEQE